MARRATAIKIKIMFLSWNTHFNFQVSEIEMGALPNKNER